MMPFKSIIYGLLHIFLRLTNFRLLALLIAVVYSACIVFLHAPIVKVVLAFMNGLGRQNFNNLVVLSAVAFTITAALLFYSLLREFPHKRQLKLLLFAAQVLLIVIHFVFLLELSIELIHATAYSVLSILLYAAFRRFGIAALLSIPVMLLDEWYQYRVLYLGYVQFFEANDVVLDLLGSGFGFLTVAFLGVNTAETAKRFIAIDRLLIVLFALALVGMIVGCVFPVYQNDVCNYSLFTLNNLEHPEIFWQVHPDHGSIYNVLHPYAAIVITTLLCLYYSVWDTLFLNNERVGSGA
jgi:hypothetical protein